MGSLTDLLYIDAGFLSSAEVMETFSCVLRWYLEADVTWSDSEFEIMERRMSDIIRYFESHGRAADLEKIGLGIQALNFHSKRQPKDATARIEVLGGVP